jgi:signal transduction histidine kinase
VLRATLALRKRALAEAGIEARLSLPDALPQVEGDRHQLQRVFLNVLVNAEQALRERGSRLEVSAEVEGPPGALAVRFFNDGPPIPAEVLPHVFDPFFTTKPEDEGTGLGLAICRRIAQEHGGDIDVRSGEEGTAFTIRLPVGPLRLA